ncbi:MAG: NHL repeat-containing protein [Blastocatellia bacterium]|nr:NHL repeat-containing protein [Blastocatellia bacterium]
MIFRIDVAPRRGLSLALLLLVIPFLTVTARSQTPGGPEADPSREAWRIDVQPHAVLGSGHPGTRPSDINQPDGLDFTATGLLLVTDSMNRRVQIWNVQTGERVGEFGSRQLGGEATNVAVAPSGTVYVADSELNLVYVFEPGAPGKAPYKFVGTRFGDEGFRKLGGMAVDAKNRLYIADGKKWEVRRYLPDGKADPTWKFERTLQDGDTALHRCEGMAIDEPRGLLYVASEADFVLKAFNLETGAFTRRMVGAIPDREGRKTGTGVFAGVVEGLATTSGYLLAVDEAAGHIHIFDRAVDDILDTDLPGYSAKRGLKATAYKGFFGHAPRVNFDVDDSPNPDFEMRKRVDAGLVNPGMVNPPGYFCSPDEVAAYTDPSTGETWIAIADQCNFRVVVYRGSDIERAARARVIPAR